MVGVLCCRTRLYYCPAPHFGRNSHARKSNLELLHVSVVAGEVRFLLFIRFVLLIPAQHIPPSELLLSDFVRVYGRISVHVHLAPVSLVILHCPHGSSRTTLVASLWTTWGSSSHRTSITTPSSTSSTRRCLSLILQ